MEQQLQQLHEFPVLLEDKNEILTLFLNEEDMAKASQDSRFLLNLIAKEQNKNSNNEPVKPIDSTHDENAIDENNADQSKTFVWPDKAVLLLIELYREREEEFSNGFKRSNKIWAEVAAQMKETNAAYNVTALQCSSKMSGLKRTYKNIIDLNKKSGNQRNTWAFFSIMDSLFGDKASIKPPAIATSEGPSNPNEEGSLSTISFLESKEPPKKRKRIENVMEEFLVNITAEKEERKEEIKKREANKEKRREENKEERNRKHKEQMEVQKSLISTLQQFLNKI